MDSNQSLSPASKHLKPLIVFPITVLILALVQLGLLVFLTIEVKSLCEADPQGSGKAYDCGFQSDLVWTFIAIGYAIVNTPYTTLVYTLACRSFHYFVIFALWLILLVLSQYWMIWWAVVPDDAFWLQRVGFILQICQEFFIVFHLIFLLVCIARHLRYGGSWNGSGLAHHSEIQMNDLRAGSAQSQLPNTEPVSINIRVIQQDNPALGGTNEVAATGPKTYDIEVPTSANRNPSTEDRYRVGGTDGATTSWPISNDREVPAPTRQSPLKPHHRDGTNQNSLAMHAADSINALPQLHLSEFV